MSMLTKKREFQGKILIECSLDHCPAYECTDCPDFHQMRAKLNQYEELEAQLEKIFGDRLTIEDVINNLYRVVQNGEDKLDYARILTNAEAEKWDRWKELEKQDRLLEVEAADWINSIMVAGHKKEYPVVKCSACGRLFCDMINDHRFMYNYCPHCGAKMQ